MKDLSISKYLRTVGADFIKHFPSSLHDSIISDAYITGGAMLNLKEYMGGEGEILNDKINDFDIYFKNKSVLLSVVRDLISYYHKEKKHKNYYEKVIEPISIKFSDIYGNHYSESDYYSDDTDKIFLTLDLPKAFNAVANDPYFRHLIKTDSGLSYLTKHSINIGKYQVIMRFVGDPDYVHSFFDFEHAKGYYEFSTGKVYYSDKTIRSIIDKELIYSGSKYPLKSVIRSLKFTKRGWKMSNTELLKMIFQLQRMDLTNKSVLEDQVIGLYGENITNFFDKIKDSGIDSDLFDDLIFTLESEVKEKTLPVYKTSPSIIDFLKDF